MFLFLLEGGQCLKQLDDSYHIKFVVSKKQLKLKIKIIVGMCVKKSC